MDEKMKRKFEKSDKSLEFMRILLLVATILLIIGCWVVAIIFWTNSTYYGRYGSSYTDGAMVGYGFLIAIGGTLLCILSYYISMFFVWLAFDVKVIRTVSTNCECSSSLKNFAKPTEM